MKKITPFLSLVILLAFFTTGSTKMPLSPAVGVSAFAEIGLLGESFTSIGIGSFAFLDGDIPVYSFDYGIALYKENLRDTSVHFASVAARAFIQASDNVLSSFGLRFVGIPYRSGFVTRSYWVPGLEFGVTARLGPALWGHLSASVLFDYFYGYPSLVSGTLRASICYYIPFESEIQTESSIRLP